jgi:PAS domain S-box-containing protein
MPPPKSAPAAPVAVSTEGVPSPHRPTEIAPQPSLDGSVLGTDESHYEQQTHGNKIHKRVANRRSAQLSRKRKKVYIDELQEENNDLRRKDQILRAIPDLIVVFDSAGKIWFVSESVSTFLGMAANELEGTSFWERLCDDSVRLLKSAFMDSLAAREPESDTVSLGSGVWELRLFDKDGNHKMVTLNGVVHFAGDRPECVCSIRPVSDKAVEAKASIKAAEAVKKLKSCNVRHHVKPQQSVVSNSSPDSSSTPSTVFSLSSSSSSRNVSTMGGSATSTDQADVLAPVKASLVNSWVRTLSSEKEENLIKSRRIESLSDKDDNRSKVGTIELEDVLAASD